MDVLEENSTNWLILKPDGSTETKTKNSNLNKLLYSHKLSGLLEYGSEMWQKEGKQNTVTIIPGDNECYTISPADAPPLEIGAHHKTEMVDALAEIYEERNGDDVMPLMELYDRVRDNRIRTEVVAPFAEALSDRVEIKNDGWFINGHLLLTFEREMYHPSTDSRERSGGGVIGLGASVEAYDINTSGITSSMSRNVTVNGEDYRLMDDEMEFLGKAVWAIENTPDRR